MSPDLQRLAEDWPFLTGVGATVLAGAVATALGALPVVLVDRLSERVTNLLLSFAAGIMLAAAMFSLLLPGHELAVAAGSSPAAAALLVIVALVAGGLALWLADRTVPHEHFCKGCEGPGPERFRRIWLFVLAIVIHNFPEGLAVGVAGASGDAAVGLSVAIGIGLQNMPEGLAVATGLVAIGYTRTSAFLAAAGSGLVEPLAGIVGAGAVALSSALLPWALGFAGGAMLFVVSSEVIPETHRPGFERGATASLFAGFSAMLFLTFALV